ncbi:glycoside hydrolase family 2 TIM barrel-domain containing protein [Paenibacillus algorifonticola]|uniref:glycoside hydrolase family 2 protein n=1 Tax=Paenibacillus algorifonticola TaxID=684063 RepID=UPI003D286104
MSRLFQTNTIRKVRELGGMWDFVTVPDGEIQLEALEYRYKLAVPGCWETHPELLTYSGRGVYRTKVTVEKRTSLRLIFKGVSHTANVFFDGKPVARHYNAYTAFDAVIRDVEAGTHELAVLVDNSFSEASSLHVPNDYYTYGGIIRPVMLEEIQELFVERLSFTPLKGLIEGTETKAELGSEKGSEMEIESESEAGQQSAGSWQADIRACVRYPALSKKHTQVQLTAKLTATIAGQTLELGSVSLQPGETATVGGVFSIDEVQSWSQENPALYLLQVLLQIEGQAAPVDDLVERVGFRTVTTEHGRIQLNGEDIVLQGFNRHEDHPLTGSSFPLPLMAQDLQLMLDMGASAVRTSHYPNDERFLDLCDEHGVLVWEENHARGLSIEQMRNPNFIWQCEQVNREMVEQHYNHPSIVIWAILNECASDLEEGRVHYKRQLEQIRALDSSRPLTFASHHRDKEICFDLADIVSCNLYPGWYGDEDPGELCDAARGWADAAGGAGKPMIMSEFGADGHYGLRDPNRVRGTEERQADIIEANLQAYTSRAYMSGMFIWQFCDCRVTEGTGWLLARAGTQNSKGIVDRYRRPKLAYEVVKKYFRGKARL